MTRIVFRMAIFKSKQLLIVLIVVHSVMLVTLLSLLGASIWSILASVMMVTSFLYYCRQYQWLKSNSAITSVDRNNDGKWTLRHKLGVHSDDLILTNCFVTQKLVILNFKSWVFWSSKSITIMSDSVDAEYFRQLRVYCRQANTFQK